MSNLQEIKDLVSRNVMINDAKDLNFFENIELDKDDFLLNCNNCVLDLSGDQPKSLEHKSERERI